MLNRDYKEFAPGVISHVYNRGNNKQPIFFDEQDYRAFLFRLGLALGIEKSDLNSSDITHSPASRIRITNSKIGQFKLYAFCLMPNHFHILLEQITDISISTLLLKVCTSYSKYFNLKYKKVGHVFQDKFKAVNIKGNPQLIWTASYIHMNPVKDRIVHDINDYKWTSYHDYINHSRSPLITRDFLLETFGNLENFITQTNEFSLSKAAFDSEIE
jgi:putative transposase